MPNNYNISSNQTREERQDLEALRDQVASETLNELIASDHSHDLTNTNATIVGNDGAALQLYSSCDNIPEEIRAPLTRLNDAIMRSSGEVRVEATDAMQDLLSRFGSAPLEDILSYIDYVYASVTQTNPLPRRRKLSDSERTQMIANRLDKRSKLYAPMGIEFSYHPPPLRNNKKKKQNRLDVSDFNGELTSLGGTATEDMSSIDVSCDDETDVSSNDNHEIDISANPAIGISQITGNVVIRQTRYDPDTCERELVNDESEMDYWTDDYHIQKHTRKLKNLLTDAGLMEGYGSKVYKDCGDMVEVCTPIHKNWKSMMDWFSQCDSIAKKHGYLPWKRTKGGGGMHINISFNKTVPNWRLAYMNFFVMIANHPQINWIFNEPSDDHTANALVLDDRFINAYDKCVKNDMTVTDEIWRDVSVCGGKGRSLSVKDEYHFEVRTFEMVRSTKELYEVATLINYLLGFCMEVATWGVLIPLEVEIPVPYVDDAEERGYWLPDDTKNILVFPDLMWNGDAKFNELVNELGLDPKTYRKYIRRNMHARRAHPYGKKFFR